MKDKVENIAPDFLGSLRPHSTYASSASSTSSYASSLSSASSASSSGSAAESFKSNSSSSFLHSKASQMVDGRDQNPQYQQQQYHTLKRYPSGTPSPTTPQLTTPTPSSPSSSPASSTFDGYATIPAKFSTLSVNPGVIRQDPRIPYTNPSVPSTPIANNFRHSVISTTTVVPNFGDQISNRLGSNYNLTRINDVGSCTILHDNVTRDGGVGAGMRGVSSLGEVTSSSALRSPHYASTPHLFVFQSIDDDSDDDNIDTSQITKSNTLSNRNSLVPDDRSSMMVANSSKTLPRQSSGSSTTAQQQKDPIYSSANEIKKDVSRREEEAARHINDHYEAPRNLSASRRSSSCSMIAQDNFCVTNQVMARIEISFRGHKTQIWTCKTMANLYTEEGCGKDATWNLRFTGVPVLLLDLGDTKSRDKRRLQIILAEKESGFELWRDVIDNLTSYKVQEPHFHTLYLSSDHRRKIGLSFNEGPAAMAFHRQLETLTSNPENISLSAPGKKKSKNKEKIPKYKAPRKTDISKPCNFHHVTTVDPTDRSRLHSMQVYSNKDSTAIAPEPINIINRPPPAAATAV